MNSLETHLMNDQAKLVVSVLQQSWRDKLKRDPDSGFGVLKTIESRHDPQPVAAVEVVRGSRSWVDPDHWVLGDPEQVVWIAGLVLFLSYRAFRHSTQHHIGCVVAIVSAIAMFVLLVWNGYVSNSGRVLTTVLTVAAFGYSVGAIVSLPIGWFRMLNVRDTPTEPTLSVSEQLSNINQELEAQLSAINDSNVDPDTKEDLQQAARDKAEERMAQIIEVGDDLKVDGQ